MTFWTACETNTEEHCLWLAHFFLLSDELSMCLILSSWFLHRFSMKYHSWGLPRGFGDRRHCSKMWRQSFSDSKTGDKNPVTEKGRQFATATIHFYFQESDMFSRCCFRQRRRYRAAWLICDQAKVKNRQSMTACSLLHLNAMKQWH